VGGKVARIHERGEIMQRNEGTLDRTVRVVAGAALIALAAGGVIGVWGYIGIVPIVTGAFGSCPLYSLAGINTCGTKG
jgi:hypothetical protein